MRHPKVSRHPAISLHKIAVLLGALVLSAAMLSSCGDDSSSSDGNTASTSSGAHSGDSGKSARDGLPEGFPDDVPLLEFTSAKKIGGDRDSGWWSILITLKNPTETPVEDYAALLTDAGYSVETGAAAAEAAGPQWDITFHSSMANTLTVGVIGN